MDAFLRRVVQLGIVGGVGISVFQSSVYNVEAGHRAVIYDRIQGVKHTVVGEGTHVRVPWLQTPITYDVRVRPRSISTTTGSKDLQQVQVTLRVLHRPVVQNLPSLYRTLGVDYDERVLPSIGNEVMKAVVAQYNAEELITKREQVSLRIREILRERAKEFNIVFDDISITHLQFGREFMNAVENKQVAEQETERSAFLVQKAKFEKEAAIIRADGESTAAKLISDALRAGPGLIQLRRIEAAREIADTLSRSRNVSYLPSGGGNILMNLPVQN